MALPRFTYTFGGLHFPGLGLWLDPHEPCTGPEKVFVSHAHSDHVAEHREVILSAPTAKLMQARMPGTRLENILEFGEPKRFEGDGSFEITLLPAGHIFGSAMARVTSGDETFLYTGDFKLRRGLSAEPCQPCSADVLVMETTFGRPQYRFPPTQEVIRGVLNFCRQALDNDEIPVLLGYSLGKSQELLCALGEAGLPIMLHGTVYRLTKVYEQFGHCFPPYEKYVSSAAAGKVLLCPPNVANSAMLRGLGRTRTAILTGWAVDPNCRYRYQCDAAFPLSDHADFPDLIEFVKRVNPKRVYTLHGFSADFAQTLRGMGLNAQALSQEEQFSLNLEIAHSQAPSRPARHVPKAVASAGATNGDGKTHPFSTFAATCSAIAGTASKLEKTKLLSEYLQGLSGEALSLACTWFSGRPFPPSQNKTLQLGWAVLRDAVCSVAGISGEDFHQVYLKHSDLGETALEVLAGRVTQPHFSIEEIGSLFNELHGARGPRLKVPILSEALERCTPREAKYLVKIITGDLRIGLKEGLVEEAVSRAFNAPADDVRKANLLLGDIGEAARLAASGHILKASLVPFRPVKLMLASPEPTAADIWARVREWHEAGTAPSAAPESECVAWIEDKYDGIRCQLHKSQGRAALFSRDLKEVSATFPELAAAALALEDDVILDGEILAMQGETALPFSQLQKRLGRKDDDLFMREKVPVKFMVFDLLWLNGETFLDRTLSERRARLENLRGRPAPLTIAPLSQATSADQIDAAFDAARARSNEGLMIKDPRSPYTPGRRGLSWLKLKKALATLDCVVVGAEYGHGKRSKVLSDYTFAVRDDDSGTLKIIGKAYTGLTDVEIAELTERFLRSAIRQHGRYFEVPPEVILEIAFDRIQPSQRHSSGLAMRFPRIVRVRTDKSVAEIDTLENARRLASADEA